MAHHHHHHIPSPPRPYYHHCHRCHHCHHYHLSSPPPPPPQLPLPRPLSERGRTTPRAPAPPCTTAGRSLARVATPRRGGRSSQTHRRRRNAAPISPPLLATARPPLPKETRVRLPRRVRGVGEETVGSGYKGRGRHGVQYLSMCRTTTTYTTHTSESSMYFTSLLICTAFHPQHTAHSTHCSVGFAPLLFSTPRSSFPHAPHPPDTHTQTQDFPFSLLFSAYRPYPRTLGPAPTLARSA